MIAVDVPELFAGFLPSFQIVTLTGRLDGRQPLRRLFNDPIGVAGRDRSHQMGLGTKRRHRANIQIHGNRFGVKRGHSFSGHGFHPTGRSIPTGLELKLLDTHIIFRELVTGLELAAVDAAFSGI